MFIPGSALIAWNEGSRAGFWPDVVVMGATGCLMGQRVRSGEVAQPLGGLAR